MKPYQDRVVIEKTELDSKIKRLKTFMDTDTFWKLAPDERIRLLQQSQAMENYSYIIGERIKAFE